jgi:protein-tyrosine phosphatase
MNEIITNLWLGNSEDAVVIGDDPRWTIIAIHDYLKHELLNEPKSAQLFCIFVNRAEKVNGNAIRPEHDYPIDLVDGVPWFESRDLVVDLKVLNKIALKIHNALKDGQMVLVHCVGGLHRSPLVVAWFLFTFGWTADLFEAYRLIKEKRPEIEERLFWLPESVRRNLFIGDATVDQVGKK